MSYDDLYASGPRYDFKMEHMRWGRFAITGEESKISEILYFQTAVDLDDPEHGPLLEELAPVRESMEIKQLGFENLIQRDLDDSRVATRLIPYLLSRNSGQVRMFPSILVLLLPMRQKRMQEYYHSRLPEQLKPMGSLLEKVTFAYGDGDRESAFEYSLVRKPLGKYRSFGAELSINRQFCRFAIVDGQHRAMAALAIHRNINQWPEAGKPFRHFYANHPRDKLLALDLSGISLPITICVFPQLFKDNPELTNNGLTVVKAARKLFLDVNKTAIVPSQARQVLLDDENILSDFVRAIMTQVKDKPDGQGGIQLWNLYYDQMEDNQGSQAMPKLASTSVLHLQYMLRMLLLGKRPQSGERTTTRCDFGLYDPSNQKNNDTLREVLDWRRRFGATTSWREDAVPADKRGVVVDSFMKQWGSVILNFLQSFPIYTAIYSAASETRIRLGQSDDEDASIVQRMLFEGQGVRAVHTMIVDELTSANSTIQETFPYPDATRIVLIRQRDRLKRWEDEAMERASALFWFGSGKESDQSRASRGPMWPSWLPENDPLRTELVKIFSQDLAGNFAKTKAFQIGVIIAIAHMERKLSEEQRTEFWRLDVPSLLLKMLSAYFRPPVMPRQANAEDGMEWVRSNLQRSYPHRLYYEHYRHVRVIFGGDLRDGRWQLIKYPILEVFGSTIPSVIEARKQWFDEKNAEGGVEQSTRKNMWETLKNWIDEALTGYRRVILRKHVDNLKDAWERDTRRSPTVPEQEEFWKTAIQSLEGHIRECFHPTKTISLSGLREGAMAVEVNENGE